jgi:hypothetical protein
MSAEASTPDPARLRVAAMQCAAFDVDVMKETHDIHALVLGHAQTMKRQNEPESDTPG